MDVNQAQFRKKLLPILKDIAASTFVTFDLEMSGISTRPRFSNNDRSQDVGKPSLQKQYEEMKSAAETFTILQFGLTCVSEDRDKEFYLAKSYNFNVSSLPAEGVDLKLERQFTFSSSASDFLKKSGFDFSKVFTDGVPYLSRHEEYERQEEYSARADKKSKIPDIPINPDDVQTVEFMRYARKTVKDWVKESKNKPEVDYCNIGYPGKEDTPLNAFQRRLVYQIIRNEFPTLQCFARSDGHFMQVKKLDVKAELEFQAKKLKQFNSLVAKQTGLRFIFEALAGGDLSAIDPEWFCVKGSEKLEDQLAHAEWELTAVREALRIKKQTIVGHNLFTDLGFLYATFVGPLPYSVTHFQEDIHEFFPRIIDTKYLATHGADAMNVRSNLKELLAPFRKVHVPLIVLHEKHTAYGASFGKEHEAGFDSWMTAELFVKLAAKLHAQRLADGELPAPTEPKAKFSKSDSDSTDSEGGVSLYPPYSRLGSLLIHEKGDLKATSPTETNSSFADEHPPAWHAARLNGNAKPYSENIYTVLEDFAKPTGEKNESDMKQWIPAFDEPFWEVYTNKLRVNAAEGGVCDLAERTDSSTTSSLL